jgi:hypothetical protein
MPFVPTQPERKKGVPEQLVGRPCRRFRRAAHVDHVESAGTTVLFDKRTYYTSSGVTANDLWALLAEVRTVEEIVTWIHEAYDAPLDVIARDVAAQLDSLAKQGLVVEIGTDRERDLTHLPEWWRPWRRRR